MKNILCYGDSITWGSNPANGTRFEFAQTWPGVLQNELGNDFRIIVEALSGRTTCLDSPFFPHKNGREYLPMLLESHSPLDLVIIMLGTNDMISTYNKTAEEAAWGILGLITIVLRSASGIEMKSPKVLVIAPPMIGQMTPFMHLAYVGKAEESKRLGECFKIIAEATGSAFIDSSKIIAAADPDGIHIDAAAHKILGMEVVKKVKEII